VNNSVLHLVAGSPASAPIERQSMKMTSSLSKSAVLLALVVLSGGRFARAQSLTALAGHWNGVNFNVPEQLQLDLNGQGQVVNIPSRSIFQVRENRLDLAANGTFTGTSGTLAISGTVTLDGQGNVSFNLPAQPVIPFRANESQDFLAAAYTPEGSSDLVLLLRAPGSLTVADLAGQWDLQQLQTPAELVQIKPQPPGLVTDVQGGDSFEVSFGNLTIAANGTLNGNSGGEPFSGMLAVTGAGEVTATIDTGEGDLQLTLFANAGKDLLLGVNEVFSQDDNFQELLILSRAPADTTAADLTGAWKINFFATPAGLTLVRDVQNVVTDLLEKNDFEAGQQALTAGDDLFFTALLDRPATGLFTINSPGNIGVNLTNTLGEISTVNFKLNAAKNALLAVNADEGHETIVLTKAPAVAGVRQDFGLMIFGNGVVWAAGSNRRLQSSDQVPGGFEDVPGSTGAHESTPPSTQTGSTFFQVVE
jgi:hypothetical protein